MLAALASERTRPTPPEIDPRYEEWADWPGAVLLSDEIKHYCEQTPPLIAPFDEKNLLKPARYQLTLGPEARVDGKTVNIDDANPLVIKAHKVAIVRTKEELCLPRFLIGRWNLRVDMVYKGLLWVGALQVDPGWYGYLPCPLYNLSDKDVEIQFGEKVFTIDFVRTTPFGTNSMEYKVEKYNPPIAYYDKASLRSGPYDLLQRMGEFEENLKRDQAAIERLRETMLTVMAVMFTAIAALVAALGVVAVRPVTEVGGPLLSFWPLTALVFSFLAFGCSAASLAHWYFRKRAREP